MDTRQPARYQLQYRPVGSTLWDKIGNGCNTPAPLFKRRTRQIVAEQRIGRPNDARPDYRVFDTVTGTAVVEEIATGAVPR